MATDNPETHNLDAEKGSGYDYDQSEAQLQAFSDKAVSTKKPSLSKGTQRQTVTLETKDLALYTSIVTQYLHYTGPTRLHSESVWNPYVPGNIYSCR